MKLFGFSDRFLRKRMEQQTLHLLTSPNTLLKGTLRFAARPLAPR
jgi:hypothetical protein